MEWVGDRWQKKLNVGIINLYLEWGRAIKGFQNK